MDLCIYVILLLIRPRLLKLYLSFNFSLSNAAKVTNVCYTVTLVVQQKQFLWVTTHFCVDLKLHGKN